MSQASLTDRYMYSGQPHRSAYKYSDWPSRPIKYTQASLTERLHGEKGHIFGMYHSYLDRDIVERFVRSD